MTAALTSLSLLFFCIAYLKVQSRDATEIRGGDSFGLTVSQKCGETGSLVVKENPESEEMK